MNTAQMNMTRLVGLKLFITLITVLGVLLIASSAFSPLIHIITQYVVDDSFYYILPAYHYGRGMGISFDGLHATNGFQPLWMLLLVLLGMLAEDRDWMLRATIVYQAVLYGAGIGLIVWAAFRQQLVVVAVAIPILWTAFGIRHDLSISLVTNGLESALYFLVAAGCFVTTLRAAAGVGSKALHAVTLTLLVLTRLDAVFIAVPLWLYVVYRDTKRQGLGQTLRGYWLGIFIGAAMILLYMLWSVQTTGLFLPVAGQIKLWQTEQLTASRFGGMATLPFFQQVAEVFARSAALVLLLVITTLFVPADQSNSLRQFGMMVASREYVAVIALAVLLVPLFLYLMTRRQRTPAAQWQGTLAAMGLGSLLHLAMHSITLWPFAEYNVWHYAGQFFVILLAIATLLESLWRVLSQRRAMFPTLLLGLVLLAVPVAQQSTLDPAPPSPRPPTERVGLYRAAQWANANLPPTAHLGAFNAGIAGYFSEAPLTNLDGLINDATIFAYLQQGTSISKYIVDEQIDYVIDYAPHGAYPLPEIGGIHYVDFYLEESAAFVMHTSPLSSDPGPGLIAAWPVTISTSQGEIESWVGTAWRMAPDEAAQHEWSVVDEQQRQIAGPFAVAPTWFYQWPPPPRHPDLIFSYHPLPDERSGTQVVQVSTTDGSEPKGETRRRVERE